MNGLVGQLAARRPQVALPRRAAHQLQVALPERLLGHLMGNLVWGLSWFGGDFEQQLKTW